MTRTISSVIGVAMFTLTSAASAALVTLPFTIKVEAVSAVAEGVAVGSQYNGAIRYDDTDLTPDGANFLIGNSLEVDFAFSRASNFAPPQLVVSSASVTASGALADLDFSIDVPNDFFFSATHLAFGYEFSKLVIDTDGNQQQVTIANGRGIFLERVSEVPAPATGLLLLPVVAMVAKRRRHARG